MTVAEYFKSGRVESAIKGTVTEAERKLNMSTSAYIGTKSDAFPTSENKRFADSQRPSGVVEVRGTLDGVPSTCIFTPAVAEQCNVGVFTDRGRNALALSSTGWEFIWNEDAIDDRYFYFGWWLHEDGDSTPVAGSAFSYWTEDSASLTAIESRVRQPMTIKRRACTGSIPASWATAATSRRMPD